MPRMEHAKDDRYRIEYLDTPVKSENDKKEYRVIRLQNGLTALLIADIHSKTCTSQDKAIDENKIEDDKSNRNDKDDKIKNEDGTNNEKHGISTIKPIESEEKKAACSLCVGVGSFSDLPKIQGLAHFVEHMVFMGSEKYPQENEIFEFIIKHGGYSNAMTNAEHTTFFFDIQQKNLLQALDRYAQFFIKPLMKKEAITRERQAVESEFQLVPPDYLKKMELFFIFARTGCPAKIFNWGNLITLRNNVNDDELYKEVHKFRKSHYSAHRIKLAIQAKLSLDTLEKYVTMCFVDVPNNELPPDDFTKFKGSVCFDTPAFRRLYKIKPTMDDSEIHLTWVMPSMLDRYKSDPQNHVTWIIGHEGKGSLTSYLRKKMWAVDMYSGTHNGYSHNSMYMLFYIAVSLTDEGYVHLEEVIDTIFSFINLVKKEGPQKMIYDEMFQIAENNFRVVNEDSPINYVMRMSNNMHFYPPCDYITGDSLFFEYDPEAIQNCMDHLVPENVNIIIIDKRFNDEELDKIGPWFGLCNDRKLKYTDTEISQEQIKRWKTIQPLADFHLPPANTFLTNDFSLISLPSDIPKYPVKIHGDTISEIWYRPDPKFRRPVCYMNFHLISPLQLTSPKNEALIDLFTHVLRRLLSEELYSAQLAGLSYEINIVTKGIDIQVNGFNEKLPLVLITIAKYIAECPKLATKELFEVVKEKLIKHYYNSFLHFSTLANNAMLSLQKLVNWTLVDIHAALLIVNFEEFRNIIKSFTDHLYIQCLVQGNMTQDAAIKNVRQFIEILNCGPLLANTIPQIRVMQIPLGANYCKLKNFNKIDVNSAIINYYQSGVGSIELSVLIDLLILMMQQPLFNQLRTKEQLSYDVSCDGSDVYGIRGYTITVCAQEDKYTTDYVDERIEEFAKSFIKILEKSTEEELENLKKVLTKMKQHVDVDLNEEVYRNWCEITTMEYMFDRIEREILAIKDIRLDELREWSARHFLNGNNFRKLSVHVVGTDQKESTDMGSHEGANSERGKEINTEKDRGKTIYSLEYITDEKQPEKTNNNRITDIEDYKKHLYVYPISEGIDPLRR